MTVLDGVVSAAMEVSYSMNHSQEMGCRQAVHAMHTISVVRLGEFLMYQRDHNTADYVISRTSGKQYNVIGSLCLP